MMTHFRRKRGQGNTRDFKKQFSDKLNNTMVFSEKMGDAYTDSQHINEGIITLESRELAQSPYNFNKIKIFEPQREGSVYLFQ